MPEPSCVCYGISGFFIKVLFRYDTYDTIPPSLLVLYHMICTRFELMT